MRLLPFLFLFVCGVWAATTTSATTTLVWATGTNSAGVTTVTESAYTQTFSSVYTSAATVPSGSIGLGSLSGTVGNVKSYSVTTVSGGSSVSRDFAYSQKWFLVRMVAAVLVPMLCIAVL